MSSDILIYITNMHGDDTVHKPAEPAQVQATIGDDNPNDDSAGGKDKTNPNASMSADEIIDANNFLGDL